MADGYLNKCKECTKSDVKLHKADNAGKVKAYDRSRHNALERSRTANNKLKQRCREDSGYKARVTASKVKWATNNSDKRVAHVVVSNAIRSGKLVKQPCEVCGSSEVEAHHEDYARHLEVSWLCKEHHMQRHKEVNEALR